MRSWTAVAPSRATLLAQRPVAIHSPIAVERPIDGQRRDPAGSKPDRHSRVTLASLVTTASVGEKDDGRGRDTVGPPQRTRHVSTVAMQREAQFINCIVACLTDDALSIHPPITPERATPSPDDSNRERSASYAGR